MRWMMLTISRSTKEHTRTRSSFFSTLVNHMITDGISLFRSLLDAVAVCWAVSTLLHLKNLDSKRTVGPPSYGFASTRGIEVAFISLRIDFIWFFANFCLIPSTVAASGRDFGKSGAFMSNFVSSTISFRSIASEPAELLARLELYRVGAGCRWASSGDAEGD